MKDILLAILAFVGSVAVFIAIGFELSNEVAVEVVSEEAEPAIVIPDEQWGNTEVVEENNLMDHHTHLAWSDDGRTWTLDEQVAVSHASVPDLMELHTDLGQFPAGTLFLYFVDGTEDHGNEDFELGMSFSTDGGLTWSDRINTRVDGAPENTIVADPSLVQLDDGTLRLYYYDFGINKTGQLGQQDHTFYSADSSDGLFFDDVTEVYSAFGYPITDPDIQFIDGLWHLLYAADGGDVYYSSSGDSLSFPPAQKIDVAGIPSQLLIDDNHYAFGCSRGIATWRLEDGIPSDEQQAVGGVQGVLCDPSPIRTQDGTYLMAVKLIVDDWEDALGV